MIIVSKLVRKVSVLIKISNIVIIIPVLSLNFYLSIFSRFVIRLYSRLYQMSFFEITLNADSVDTK